MTFRAPMSPEPSHDLPARESSRPGNTSTTVLIRVQLNPRSRTVRRDLGDAAQMHRTVMSLAPDGLGETPRRRAGLLYRIDESPDHLLLLVQGDHTLRPDRLPPGYGQAAVKDLAPMFTALDGGLAVRYRIVANPIRQIRPDAGPVADGSGRPGRGKPKALYGADALTWWQQRAESAGLAIRTTSVTRVRAAYAGSGPSTRLLHVLTRFEGLAVIQDPEKVRTAVIGGIGKGKSYGAGLLTLAPALRG